MRQELTTDSVERHIEASPDALYEIIADVTSTPELTPTSSRDSSLSTTTLSTTTHGRGSGPVAGSRRGEALTRNHS